MDLSIDMEASLSKRRPDTGSPKMGDCDRITVLGIPIDRITMPEAVDRARAFLDGGGSHIIVTADSAGLVMAQRDAELRDIMRSADLVTPDSTGILLAARLAGTPLPQRVSGIDLAQEICRLCAESGQSVFFLGAAPGVADEAANALRQKFPSLRIAGTHDGFFEDDAPVIQQVRQSGAGALFAAMGIPKQEKWIARHIKETGVAVAIGLGGSFDVFSGRVERAPAWMRNHGLEWVYRLARNPRKIRKVAHLPVFALLTLAERLGLRRKNC